MPIKFLDKTKGYNVPLTEFPGLFTMEAHTGFFGFAFSGGWNIGAWLTVPSMWSNGGTALVVVAWAIPISFFLLGWLSMSAGKYLADEIRKLPKDSAQRAKRTTKLEVSARAGITALSASYVLVSCCLIWLTDGAASPFTPFYVMIFTLTIAKLHLPYPGGWVLFWSLVVILIACIGAQRFGSLISRADLGAIEQSHFHYYAHVAFLCLSLIVPTVSQWWAATRHVNRTPRRPRPGGLPSPPETQPTG